MKLGVAGTGRMDFNNPTGTRGLVAVDKVGGKVRSAAATCGSGIRSTAATF